MSLWPRVLAKMAEPLKHATEEKWQVLAECLTTKARAGVLHLPHYSVHTPVFMPVGTKGCMKGVLPEQLEHLGVQILLANTYHLALKPGVPLLQKTGGLHKFMNWKQGMLTLSQVTEEGVEFISPYSSEPNPSDKTIYSKKTKKAWNNLERVAAQKRAESDAVVEAENEEEDSKGDLMMLTPEKSMEVQNAIGADIMMQLDDVVSSTTTGERVGEAMLRSVRWLERCRRAHARRSEQFLFPIVQGGLDEDLRRQSVEGITKTDWVGCAIGGLSGLEEKSHFWRMVTVSTDLLPKTLPRYVMGVGYAEDLLVCCALGADMFDCVFPTRTARFGCALVITGQLNLKLKTYRDDFNPIDDQCQCLTCRTYTRSYLHHIVTNIPVASRLVSIHNIYFQMELMQHIREAVKTGRFPEFVRSFMKRRYADADQQVPQWIADALISVGIDLGTAQKTVGSREEDGEPSGKRLKT